MRKSSTEPNITLESLIGLGELQQMQDSFSEAADITIRTTDPSGKFLTDESRTPSLCKEVFSIDILNKKACGQCLPTFLGGEGIVDDELSFECLPGFKKYIVPLKISITPSKSLILGYMILGPVLFMKRKDKEEVQALARDYGVDFDYLWNQFLELRVFSYKGIHSLLDMIDNLTRRVLNLAYSKSVIQKKMNYLSDTFSEKGLSKVSSSEEFLELFLDFVMSYAKGTRGSVMTLDARQKNLKISAASGLPKDVVKKTCVRLGEGVAGLAAETKKSFLINRQSSDKVLADRLKKPELSSAVVIPIRYRESVYGVLNVASDETSPVEFNESNLTFLSKAAGLAGVALHHFKN